MKKTTQLMDYFDLYSQPVPGFNFEGRGKIGSCTGTLSSALVLSLLVFVSAIKFSHMMTGNSTNISNT